MQLDGKCREQQKWRITQSKQSCQPYGTGMIILGRSFSVDYVKKLAPHKPGTKKKKEKGRDVDYTHAKKRGWGGTVV